MEEIKSKISVIQERVRRLKKLSDISFEKFIGDFILKDAIERNLEVAIQACLDIAKMIIKYQKLREPSDNKGAFVVLAENGLISEESLSFLIPMAGTRNILVHGYDKVDDTVLFGILKKHLNNFNRFISEIQRNFLDKQTDAD